MDVDLEQQQLFPATRVTTHLDGGNTLKEVAVLFLSRTYCRELIVPNSSKYLASKNRKIAPMMTLLSAVVICARSC